MYYKLIVFFFRYSLGVVIYFKNNAVYGILPNQPITMDIYVAIRTITHTRLPGLQRGIASER